MKISRMFCLLAFIGLQSCKESKGQTVGHTTSEAVQNSQCYQAIYEEDTVRLTVRTLKNGKIAGDMQMKILNEPAKTGKIAGTFKGDTLFADYTFILGSNEKRTFKNPMAFLKKDNRLILGNGQIQTTMGASYFVKTTPIDFERVKYKFSMVTCNSQ